MKKASRYATVLAVVGAGSISAFALPGMAGAGGMSTTPATTHGNSGSHRQNDDHPGPTASLPSKARAYGRYCQTQSKRHVAGQTGTPFSQCVTAMARLATNRTNSAREACKALSKRHVAGQKGTPYSRCVVAGNRLRQSLHT
jgi:hypothetical protein